jgi:hypothetical protein
LHHLARWLTSIEKDDENMRIFLADTLDFTFTNDIKIKIEMKSHTGKDTSFIPPGGGRAAEAFQSFFSHIDGKIRDGYGEDGCGRKVVGTDRLILIQHSPYL